MKDPREINRMQHIAMNESRPHIPPLIGFDVVHDYRTIYPVPLAMSASLVSASSRDSTTGNA